MGTVEIKLSADLVRAAGLSATDPSAGAARLLALELYRENKVSLGRAAELCQNSVEEFMEFAGRHEVSLHYGLNELEEDRHRLQQLGL